MSFVVPQCEPDQVMSLKPGYDQVMSLIVLHFPLPLLFQVCGARSQG